jgi:CDP-diacylglycerol--serine O-phosphatidyltransferase
MSNDAIIPKRFNPIPSMFTLCNALCGFTAILYTLKSPAADTAIPILSIYLIIGAMVFDVLDGLAARVLNAQSVHGMNLDSIADVISFGVAPAVIIYQCGTTILSETGYAQNLSWLAAAFYLGCGVWRLAAYNTQAALEPGDHGHFTGLPSPGGAAIICSMALLIPQLGLEEIHSFTSYMAYAIISAILMVSPLPYTHIRRGLTGRKKWVIFSLGLIALAALFLYKIWALVAFAHIYMLHSPLMTLESRIVGRIHKIRTAGITPLD